MYIYMHIYIYLFNKLFNININYPHCGTNVEHAYQIQVSPVPESLF